MVFSYMALHTRVTTVRKAKNACQVCLDKNAPADLAEGAKHGNVWKKCKTEGKGGPCVDICNLAWDLNDLLGAASMGKNFMATGAGTLFHDD
jgi:hypothetical protein